MRSIIFIEIFAIAAQLLPADMLAPLPFEVVARDACDRIRVSPQFIIGWVLLALGAYVRKACYTEMGKNFTFELTIRKDHRLVTSGPYSVVRHPSYAAVCLVAAGSILCLLGSGSWLVECGALSSSAGKLFALLQVIDLSFVPMVMVFSRVKTEDAMLRSTFGKEWDEWAKRTPCAIIPGIY